LDLDLDLDFEVQLGSDFGLDLDFKVQLGIGLWRFGPENRTLVKSEAGGSDFCFGLGLRALPCLIGVIGKSVTTAYIYPLLRWPCVRQTTEGDWTRFQKRRLGSMDFGFPIGYSHGFQMKHSCSILSYETKIAFLRKQEWWLDYN
jgi:hypothetical protein